MGKFPPKLAHFLLRHPVMAQSLGLCLAVVVATAITGLFTPQPAQGRESCMYKTDDGIIKTATSANQVPSKYRNSARCVKMAKKSARKPQQNTTKKKYTRNQSRRRSSSGKPNNRLARPDQIDLKGNVRREKINSPVGTIELRWPRSVESVFGRTPLRAMSDAARTISKATKTAAFPSFIQNMNIRWNVIFMDENLPSTQIPQNLISNCHPGWMTPPANIYIVAQRVAAGCGGSRSVSASVADSQLTEVLVHEMGHALEYQLLAKIKNYRFDRKRSEGFATWFEMYAAQYSSFMNQRKQQQRTANYAKLAIQRSPNTFHFDGTALGYSRAAMYFSAVEDRFGIRGVVEVYEKMVKNNMDFKSAIRKVTLWDAAKLEQEAKRVAEKY